MEVFNVYVYAGRHGAEKIGTYFVYSKNNTCFSPHPDVMKYKKWITDKSLLSEIHVKAPIKTLDDIITEENRSSDFKQKVYVSLPYVIMREAKRTGRPFVVYQCGAEKGERGYSPIDHSAPHPEGPEGMEEWATHYYFYKMDDGTYEAEISESWYWGGSHSDGGEITNAIPEEWFDLPYDEFLEKLITIPPARHYQFTVEQLKSKKSLRKFFGFEEEKAEAK